MQFLGLTPWDIVREMKLAGRKLIFGHAQRGRDMDVLSAILWINTGLEYADMGKPIYAEVLPSCEKLCDSMTLSWDGIDEYDERSQYDFLNQVYDLALVHGVV